MRTFDRYFIHFMIIGLAALLIGIILLAADRGELLVPVFLVAITFVDMIFVMIMTCVFSAVAAPKTIRFKIDKDIVVEEKILEIAKKKWKRNKVVETNDKVKYLFGNRYKDWLTTGIELIKKEDYYILNLPSAYIEDIRNIEEIYLI